MPFPKKGGETGSRKPEGQDEKGTALQSHPAPEADAFPNRKEEPGEVKVGQARFKPVERPFRRPRKGGQEQT